MRPAAKAFVLAVSSVLALALGGDADARGGRARGERARAKSFLRQADSAGVRAARLDLRRRSLNDQMFRVRLQGAAARESARVLIADADGRLRSIGSLARRGRGARAQWEVRTSRGEALPFGVADVAALSGRPLEVRGGDGTLLADGVVPDCARATGAPSHLGSLRTYLEVDPEVAGEGVRAHVEIEREDDGDALEVEVEHAAPGLALEAWLVAPDGAAVKLGDLVAEEHDEEHEEADDDLRHGDAKHGEGHDADHPDDGDAQHHDDDHEDDDADDHDDGDDDDDDDDDHDDDGRGDDVEYEFELSAADGLPFEATSLADLAGYGIEVRRADDQAVLARGFLPDASLPDAVERPDDDDDGDDRDDDEGDDDHPDREPDRDPEREPDRESDRQPDREADRDGGADEAGDDPARDAR